MVIKACVSTITQKDRNGVVIGIGDRNIHLAITIKITCSDSIFHSTNLIIYFGVETGIAGIAQQHGNKIGGKGSTRSDDGDILLTIIIKIGHRDRPCIIANRVFQLGVVSRVSRIALQDCHLACLRKAYNKICFTITIDIATCKTYGIFIAHWQSQFCIKTRVTGITREYADWILPTTVVYRKILLAITIKITHPHVIGTKRNRVITHTIKETFAQLITRTALQLDAHRFTTVDEAIIEGCEIDHGAGLARSDGETICT